MWIASAASFGLTGLLALMAYAHDVSALSLITKARALVSFNAIGPFEMHAAIKLASSKGEERGTYRLEWAAPDKFREEIHLPNYDEVRVVSPTTLSAKRDTKYRPLAAFRIEEMMDIDELLGRVQADASRAAKLVASQPASSMNIEPSRIQNQVFGTGDKKQDCIWFWADRPEQVCANRDQGWPSAIAVDSTADDEIVEYDGYKRIGLGFLPHAVRYYDNGRLVLEADVKSAKLTSEFPPDTFASPDGAERETWCSGEIPAQLLALKPPVPVTAEDMQNAEIVDAFVNADGTPSRFVMLRSGGPAEDEAMRKLIPQMRFTPAVCGDKPVESEAALVVDSETVSPITPSEMLTLPQAGDKGYTAPTCQYCPKPAYSDAGFKVKVQGEVILTIIILPNGRAANVYVIRGLGYGLDQQAAKTIREQWRFTPAKGPSGKPAAVRMLIEIDFHLY